MKRVLAILKKLLSLMSRLITMAIMVAVFYCMFMFADLEKEKADSERHNERSRIGREASRIFGELL